MLDSHNSDVMKGSQSGSFILAINQMDDYMTVLDAGYQIETGFHSHVQITPTRVTSTPKFDKLGLEKRECKQRDEKDQTALSLYK